ncbi:hypothetical protein AMECASPLE_032559 [Ameca splendens]|uniref:Uncharacterized protein n=1 Tax=Ameca splendens TaxID=208324 RepID=A0ABV0XJN2_9TELE
MDIVHPPTLPIHSLYSQVQVPIPHRDNQPPEPGVGPLPLGVETGRPPQHLNLVWAGPGFCLNLSDPGPDPFPHPDPSPQRPPPSSREGPMYKRGVYMVQTSPPTRATTDQNSPNPPMNSNCWDPQPWL